VSDTDAEINGNTTGGGVKFFWSGGQAGEGGNSKSERRNSKQIGREKEEILKEWKDGFSAVFFFFLRICFEFRVSDFEFGPPQRIHPFN
jgi:hypothetical protein